MNWLRDHATDLLLIFNTVLSWFAARNNRTSTQTTNTLELK